jgi:hypothetical protein
LILADAVVVFHHHDVIAGALQDGAAHFGRQILPRCGHLDLEVTRQTLKTLAVVLRRRIGPGRNGAFGHRQARIGHD